MKRYLDPKNDLVFKRIFGEHPHLVRAFLNAVLPLAEDERIESLDYLPGEQVPEIPLHKDSIVDVRCRDKQGRQFIVEMQMEFTNAFLQRVLFNASKAYVRQLERGEKYEMLQPVIGLSVLDDVFDRESGAYFHHYKVINVKNPAREIQGLQLVFVELPKFRRGVQPSEREDWLRFLRETGEKAGAPEDLAGKSEELAEALHLAEEAAYTPDQLLWYDRYWDSVSTQKTLLSGRLEEGRNEGRKEGRKEGLLAGTLRTLQEVLGLPVDDPEILAEKSAVELEGMIQELRARFAKR